MTPPAVNGPPKNVAPETLFARLAQSKRPTKVIDFPRKNAEGLPIAQVALVVLTSGEQQKCRAAAEAYALDMLRGNPDGVPFRQVVDVVGGRSLGYEELYRNELAIETVCAAVREPTEKLSAFFPNSQLARLHTTTDEITVLFMAYCEHQSESGPIVSSMDVPTMEAWIRRLQEGASRVPLAQLSSEALRDLVMHLASLLPRSATDSGSPGWPPDENSLATGSLPGADEKPAPVLRDD